MAVVESSAATIGALAMNRCHDWIPAGAATDSAVGAVAGIPDGSNQSPMAAAHWSVAAVPEGAAVAVAEGPVRYRVHREYSSILEAASWWESMSDATLA